MNTIHTNHQAIAYSNIDIDSYKAIQHNLISPATALWTLSKTRTHSLENQLV